MKTRTLIEREIASFRKEHENEKNKLESDLFRSDWITGAIYGLRLAKVLLKEGGN